MREYWPMSCRLIFTKGCAALCAMGRIRPLPDPIGLAVHREAAADVRVRVRGRVVVHVEQPVVQALAIVTTDVQTRVGRVEVPVIRNAQNETPTAAQKAP